jgi:ribosome-associated protein
MRDDATNDLYAPEGELEGGSSRIPGETRRSAADDAITLNDVLKLSGLAGTGGQAKGLIQSGQVTVNGETETRRKRKLYEGDVVRVGDEEFVLELDGEEELGDSEDDL